MKSAFKFTRANRQAIRGVTDYPPVGRWSSPRNPKLCISGWHIPTNNSLSQWLNIELWEVEVDGKSVLGLNKESHELIRFVQQTKWSKKSLVAYAIYCAERARSYGHAAAGYAADAADAAADAADAAGYAADVAAGAAGYAGYAAERTLQSEWILAHISQTGIPVSLAKS